MTDTLVKFPNRASRRILARKPRRSKNGTPEERLAKAVAAKSASATTVVQIAPRAPSTNTVAAQQRMDALLGSNREWAEYHLPTIRMAGVVLGQDDAELATLRGGMKGAFLPGLVELCRETKAHLEELVTVLDAAIARCGGEHFPEKLNLGDCASGAQQSNHHGRKLPTIDSRNVNSTISQQDQSPEFDTAS
jgi:hypothetical protein